MRASPLNADHGPRTLKRIGYHQGRVAEMRAHFSIKWAAFDSIGKHLPAFNGLNPRAFAMRIMCPIHGCQPVKKMSADFLLPPVRIQAKHVKVTYEYLGSIVDECFLSEQFAVKHNISGGVVPLPDVFPEWQNELVAVCEKCFRASIGDPTTLIVDL